MQKRRRDFTLFILLFMPRMKHMLLASSNMSWKNILIEKHKKKVLAIKLENRQAFHGARHMTKLCYKFSILYTADFPRIPFFLIVVALFIENFRKIY